MTNPERIAKIRELLNDFSKRSGHKHTYDGVLSLLDGIETDNEELRDRIEELQAEWSFDTVMFVADKLLERYPADIFIGKSPTSDCGTRLVAALRDCRATMATERSRPNEA